MKIRPIILSLSAILLFAIGVSAQDKPIERERTFRSGIFEHMDLNEDQKTKLDELRSMKKIKMQSILHDENLSKEEKKSAIAALSQDAENQLKGILNDKQLEQYNAFQAQRKERKLIRKERMMERREKMKERKQERKKRMEKARAMRKDIRDYREQNIDPVLKKQRSKLEEALSQEDRELIDQLRDKRTQLKEESKVKRQEAKKRKEEMKKLFEERKKSLKGKENFDKDMRKKRMEERKEMRKKKSYEQKEKRNENKEDFEYLLNKYESELAKLMDEIEGERQRWKNDLGEIRQSYFQDKERKRSIDKDRKAERKEFGSMVHFLLLDPLGTAPAPSNISTTISNFNAFPNPAKDYNTISFTLSEGSNVQIGLYEESGKLVKTILNEYVDSGQYDLNVNISDLPGGLYVYSIKTISGVQSVQIMISK